MTSETLGSAISAPVEVANVSPQGFWLWLGNEELFVSFAEFPWFKDATIRKLVNVERPSALHLYWPDLDVDVSVESIRHPDRFPLISRTPSTHA